MGTIFWLGTTITLGIYEIAQNKLCYQSIFSARQNKTSRMLTWYILNCSLWSDKYMIHPSTFSWIAVFFKTTIFLPKLLNH